MPRLFEQMWILEQGILAVCSKLNLEWYCRQTHFELAPKISKGKMKFRFSPAAALSNLFWPPDLPPGLYAGTFPKQNRNRESKKVNLGRCPRGLLTEQICTVSNQGPLRPWLLADWLRHLRPSGLCMWPVGWSIRPVTKLTRQIIPIGWNTRLMVQELLNTRNGWTQVSACVSVRHNDQC